MGVAESCSGGCGGSDVVAAGAACTSPGTKVDSARGAVDANGREPLPEPEFGERLAELDSCSFLHRARRLKGIILSIFHPAMF